MYREALMNLKEDGRVVRSVFNVAEELTQGN